jgi:predicted nucleotide-binding protein
MAKKVQQEKAETNSQEKDKRKYLNQSMVPIYTLEEALKVPQAILDNFGGKPTAPFQVAMAIESTQTSSFWRKLSGSAVAYGLTDGGYNSAKIGLTDLALKILSPTEEEVDKIAKVEASLRPSVLKQFFEKYNNSKFPKDAIAENVLKLEFNIPAEDSSRILEMIKANGKFTGIIHDTKTGPYVFADEPASNEPTDVPLKGTSTQDADEDNNEELPDELAKKLNLKRAETPSPLISPSLLEKPKVFISHGKNKKVVEQLKEILTFGQFDVTVSVEKETTAISVPDKVFSDMRNSNAAVIHVESERELLDSEGNKHYVINENVLIEIGAAIALYGKKFVLLCEHSVKLPSNLQGLYRCNYEGKELSYEATMKLLKAFNEFRVS